MLGLVPAFNQHYHTFEYTSLRQDKTLISNIQYQPVLDPSILNPSEFKMRFSSAATIAALSLLSGADAIISSFTAPSTIAPGQPFTITLNTENYTQGESVEQKLPSSGLSREQQLLLCNLSISSLSNS